MVDLVYIPGRKISHITDQGTVSYCRLWMPEGFWGTGSQEEYENASSYPICKKCLKKAGGKL